MTRGSDKRERLLEAGRAAIHEQGLRGTTLADLAARANVPLGNVYYYFRTKEELAAAVITSRQYDIDDKLDRLNELATPSERLAGFIAESGRHPDDVARYGCPFGTLAQELAKQPSPLGQAASRLIESQLEWLTLQFEQLGCAPKPAAARSQTLYAAMQGASLLSHALHEPGIVAAHFSALIESIPEPHSMS